MASNGIKDRVAIVGMGCTRFGERWDKGADELLVDAVQQCFAATPALPKEDVDAYWLGTMNSGQSGTVLSKPLGIDYKPVTRVENMCATGSEAFRNACYAVASGAYDRVMAVGVEKLKDTGYSGLVRSNVAGDGTAPEETLTAPAAFSLLDPAYCRKYGVDPQAMRDAMTHVAWKNHVNGAKNERAQFRKEVPKEKIDAGAGKVAGRLGVMDCSGVSDGAACALIVRAEDAYRYTDRPIFVKALSVIAGPASGPIDPGYDYTTFHEVVASAKDAYAQAGISDPRREISLAEVHDCFTPTELVLMEDMGFSARGQAWRDELDGVFDLGGALPVNPDGGLKSFGHPVGASGLRMLFECWLQFRGEAGERQIADARLGLTHNLGGRPGTCVSFISIVGAQQG
ncbi:acetyl-CoA acetyltransferase [Conexibacter sp. JD483]|uniref:acetyl-CoA acetyltransferase n=1 Tax=unclassified Conexibacter TaxID=2627773 RepID=UPI002727BC18|nr:MULTISPECIES: acetyl-CoA acetyltransferase [unclassified Conexibacter]MDO8187717.1 acetyl-CoA acetyltransferase [Conexibacter sp. CPCC 205706]MDO8200220.1 acetyl-CoA acetyltransferase [Conexibacter sp. CPCC 205762]MDR9369396.1 acetyl-CoA acetyltransferase [Conexibacter sp. JD483]